MEDKSKMNKLFTTGRSQGEAENWIFSLVPVAVAFVFYIVFTIKGPLNTIKGSDTVLKNKLKLT